MCLPLCIYYYIYYYSFFYPYVAINFIYLAYFYKILQNADFFHILIPENIFITENFVYFIQITKGDSMSSRKMNLGNKALPELSFRLLSISSSKFEDDWTSYPHSHRFTEIFFIKSGTGYMQIENETIPVKADSLVLIGAQVLHTEFSNSSDPLDYYVLGVEGLKINTDRPAEYSVVNSSANSSSIRLCFESILREMHNKKTCYEEICQHYLAILILLIYRKDHVSYELVEPQNSSRECHKARRYIEDNYHSKITLDLLADNCNITKYYLSHQFTELYGKSPIAYLTEVRISAAKDLLTTTSYSIEEIAGSTGFSSSSYFSQTFQKICHVSPQQYRKMHIVL